MATELRPITENLTQTRFFGGKERGPCIQITQTGQAPTGHNTMGIGYVSLTRDEAAKLCLELALFAAGHEIEAV